MPTRIHNKCLVIASTAAEIAPFLKIYGQDPAGFPELDILVTGVGMTATTWSLTRQIGIKRPAMVIQAGIAGCFDPMVQLGTVFVVKRDTIADMGVIEKNTYKTIFDLDLADPDQQPFSKGWLVNKSSLLQKTRLKKINAVTSNEITTAKNRIDMFRKKFEPVIESMEGAALHYVCINEQLPFLQLRAVSNYIGERNKNKWFLKESIHNLNHQLTRLLYSI